MDRERVGSSTILTVGYDEASETLEIEFVSGAVYQYYNLPKPVWEQFSSSPSKGLFFNTYIKNFYPFSRVG